MYVTLEDIKKQLNIDESFKDDDNYLMGLIDVAEDSVSKHLDIDLIELEDENRDLPPSIYQAIMMMVGTLYGNRENITYGSVAKIPYSMEYLLQLNKNYYLP